MPVFCCCCENHLLYEEFNTTVKNEVLCFKIGLVTKGGEGGGGICILCYLHPILAKKGGAVTLQGV